MDELKKCLICHEFKPLKKFNRNSRNGKIYSYHKKCTQCLYKHYRKLKGLFRWKTATFDQKKARIIENFKRNTVLNQITGCLLWNKSLSKKGYPGVFFDGKFSLASRVCWTIHHGEIPKGLWVLHTCDTPACLEISHLFLGTASDNRRDCRDKGRMTVKRGVDSNFAKLTENDVKEIKKLLNNGETQYKIAQKFNVSRGCICDIKRNRNWKHVQI